MKGDDILKRLKVPDIYKYNSLPINQIYSRKQLWQHFNYNYYLDSYSRKKPWELIKKGGGVFIQNKTTYLYLGRFPSVYSSFPAATDIYAYIRYRIKQYTHNSEAVKLSSREFCKIYYRTDLDALLTEDQYFNSIIESALQSVIISDMDHFISENHPILLNKRDTILHHHLLYDKRKQEYIETMDIWDDILDDPYSDKHSIVFNLKDMKRFKISPKEYLEKWHQCKYLGRVYTIYFYERKNELKSFNQLYYQQLLNNRFIKTIQKEIKGTEISQDELQQWIDLTFTPLTTKDLLPQPSFILSEMKPWDIQQKTEEQKEEITDISLFTGLEKYLI